MKKNAVAILQILAERIKFTFRPFGIALIKIYSYFRLYTFMSIYVKNSC